MMDQHRFFNACMSLMNIDMHELVEAGIIAEGNVDNGGSSWKRFTNDPLIFIAKIDDQKRDALWKLLEARQKPIPEPLYVIWSNEHLGWWRPNRAGYTRFLDSAGRYSRQEALEIAKGRFGWPERSAPDEIAVRLDDALHCTGERCPGVDPRVAQLEEIADGAFSDNPLSRKRARDEAARLRSEDLPDACENCGNTLNDGSDICDQCGGAFVPQEESDA